MWVLTAWGLTLPAFIQSLGWSAQPEDPNGPANWAMMLYLLAFPLGLAGLWVVSRREGRSPIRRETLVVKATVVLAIAGAVVWGSVFLLVAEASL